AARPGAQPAGSGRRADPCPRPRGHQHLRHEPDPGARQHPRRDRALGPRGRLRARAGAGARALMRFAPATRLRGALPPPRDTSLPIDVGNAGTLLRLLPGWLAGQEGRAYTLDGDESIRRRPVDRIAEPLERMGARVVAREGRFAPFTVYGAHLRSAHHEL